MIGNFKEEERAQGAIEYILLAGGIIAATVVIFAVYSSMVSSAGTALNASVGAKVGEIGSAINSPS